MIRFQIYLTKVQKQILSELSRAKSTSVTELVRRAIDEYILREKEKSVASNLDKFFAMLSDCKGLPDFKAIRASLDRD